MVKDAQIASLTGMRGFAALMVVVLHVTGNFGQFKWLGLHGYGPIALFVLSGFLLYRPFGRWALGISPCPSLTGYTVRRVLRIFPAYWATLHLWYLIGDGVGPSSFADWVGDVTFWNTLRYMDLVPGLQQAWSMGVEFLWYVALPLLAAVAHLVLRPVPQRLRLRVHVVLLLLALPVSVGYTVWSHQQDMFDSATMWLPKFLVCFAAGALVSLVMEAERAGLTDISRGRRLMGDPWFLPLVVLALIVVNTSRWATSLEYRPPTLTEDLLRDGSAFGIALGLLVISIFSGPRAPLNRFLGTRLMQVTGRWSYGIYLWHLPVIVLALNEIQFSDGLLGLGQWMLLVLPVSYVLGAASYAWVEEPAMRLAKEVTDRREASRASAGRSSGPRREQAGVP